MKASAFLQVYDQYLYQLVIFQFVLCHLTHSSRLGNHCISLQVCYTQGTVDGLEVARKHFATALKLNPDNLRALYGFCSVG